MGENCEWQSPPAFRLEWDVFLNFRGDTRKILTEPLRDELKLNNVRAFMDDEGLTQGDKLNPKLPEAIEDSAAAITIISPRYASSRWCLEELAKICECGRLILPIFYHVDPSDVRRQRGPFAEDFKRLERSTEKQADVARWRAAMESTGAISGWVVPENRGGEHLLIQLVVRRILNELSKTPMNMASFIVGQRYRIENLIDLLNFGSNGIRILGLCGMGGIGKTTLVKALYNKKLVAGFEHRCFISNVRESFGKKQNGLDPLRRKITNELSFGSENDQKRVLIVLDDVDDASQFIELASWWRKWLDNGSRIIITTRDRKVLNDCCVDDVYEVKPLGDSDSLQLFLYHALRSKKPTERFSKLSSEIASLTGGLPLALEVFGSFLFDKRRVEEWEDALQKLKQIRPYHLHDILKISFDGLDVEEQRVFLDIACLFVNLEMKRERVIDVLKGCGFRAEISINVLVARSLIRIMDDDSLWMHDQIRDTGRQIVREENANLGKRSRLWDRGEIANILQNGTGTECIEGMIVDLEKRISPMDRTTEFISGGRFQGEEVVLETKVFQSMAHLRLLQLNKVRLMGDYKCVPVELKWLQWRGCSLDNLPYDFCPQLTVLDVSESKLVNVWDQKWRWWSSAKVPQNLMVMDLHGCYNLTAIPDLSRHPALEKLILERCVALTTIHDSLGHLVNLRHLNMKDCSNLVKFPSYVSGLKNIDTIILSGCSNLKSLPHELRGLSSLRELFIDRTAIEELPSTIFWLTKLEVLSLDYCQSLKQLPDCLGMLDALKTLSATGSALEKLPDSICKLEKLETLNLIWCTKLTMLPNSIGNLKSLTNFWFSGGSVGKLPDSIGLLTYLKELSVGNCSNICKLPISIGGLASVVELNLDGLSITSLPDQVNGLKSLEKLEVRNCKRLESLPESIRCILTLTTLVIESCAITKLPESIGMLENLSMLRLMKCVGLCELPSSFGNLKSLHHLYMEGTIVPKLPENFGMLSKLITLKMAKKRDDEQTKSFVFPDSFSNLSSLEEFDASSWKIVGKIADDFEKLSCLEILNLSRNDFDSLPCNLRGLSVLKKFFVEHCENLKSLPPLPSSLVELNAANCIALETISDLSNLEKLRDLNLANCVKLMGVPGIEFLKSLRRLYMGGCSPRSLEAKNKLDKLAIRKLYNLSWPGNQIPDWFAREEICFSTRRDFALKAVIIGVIVSINQDQIPNNLRGHLPVVPNIQIKILRMQQQIFKTGPPLAGVPNTNEDHFFLCRYEDYHPLVSILRDGDKIKVEMQDPPMVEGIQMKASGIHLVFDNYDDYVRDEHSLPEKYQSASHKLTSFIGESSQTSGSVSKS